MRAVAERIPNAALLSRVGLTLFLVALPVVLWQECRARLAATKASSFEAMVEVDEEEQAPLPVFSQETISKLRDEADKARAMRNLAGLAALLGLAMVGLGRLWRRQVARRNGRS